MILVCGEALIDMVISSNGARRPSPGGGPYNTARALARLGVPTAFLGHFSTDAFGQLLAEQLAADGVNLAFASVGPEPTTVAVARVGADGLATYEFAVEGTSAPELTADMIPGELPEDVTAIHVGTLGLVLQPMAATLTELIRGGNHQRLVILDPNIRPALEADPQYRHRLKWLIAQSTVLKASLEDLEWLYPGIDHVAAAERILSCGVRVVLVTLGMAGAYGATQFGRVSVPAVPVEVVDTIGAGDAFGAASLAWLYDRDLLDTALSLPTQDLESLLEFSCMAAALTCSRSGADPPSRSELQAALSSVS